VHITAQVDLRRIARGIGMPEEEILALNPMYRLGVVPGGQEGWPVRLPLALVPRYIAQESSWVVPEPVEEAVALATPAPAPKPAAKKPSAIVYKVKPGDMLGSIARKHGVTVAQLTKWNGLKGTTIRPGQKLTIHVARGN
jgi:membrane-bound lytic murein transglycosylase D